MVVNQEKLHSKNKKTRLEEYKILDQAENFEEIFEVLKEGINDSYDTIRSTVIEILCETYSKKPNFDLAEILVNRLKIEDFWVIKFLLLKKLKKHVPESTHKYTDILLPFLEDYKPQIRLVTVELLNELPKEYLTDKIASDLVTSWKKERDNDTRSQMMTILKASKNPKIKNEIANYTKKLAEKEKKKKEIAGMFEGI